MSTTAYWWITLGLGLVVAVVAVVLLELLYRQVRRIEEGAAGIWRTGKLVAQNTATSWLLGTVTTRLDELADEAGRHEALLERKGG